jgi:hypothetical protein
MHHPPSTTSSPSASLDPITDPNAQQHKLEFVDAARVDDPVNPHRLTAAPSPYLLSAGSVIAASLIAGLRSDLPGIVTAQVTENACDSPTGRTLLVPRAPVLSASTKVSSPCQTSKNGPVGEMPFHLRSCLEVAASAMIICRHFHAGNLRGGHL